MNMKLEVVFVPVSDIDRAKAFYEKAGFRLDIDYVANEKFRALQFTPPQSGASIIFGKGITSAKSGPVELVLAVEDVAAARADLIGRGINVSEVFHYAGGPFNNSGENPRVPGPEPSGHSYFSFASFEDPDGNRWQMQEIKERLPGREWKQANGAGPATVADLLRETGEHHHHYEITHAEHHWWDWYAPYFTARQNGSSPEEASAAADRYMDETFHIPRR